MPHLCLCQASDIKILKEIIQILKPCLKVTEEMSSEKYVSGSKAIPMIKCLREYLETITPTNYLTVQLKNTLLNKIKKRFDNIQKVHLFSMATVLDPRFKKIHLDDGTALARIITSIKIYLNENSDLGAVPVLSQASDEGDPEDIWQAHRQKLMTESSCRSEGAGTSELDVYIAAPLTDLKSDPLAIWKSYEGAYPKQTKLACKHLLVSASSAPAERLFSKAGNIVRKTRNLNFLSTKSHP
ncbi:hypothetical protein ABMA28_012992 [Loxostege sticticalis]|uniref:HAT C-terminal dimerisation domain-containing protein n=1 Tax=Loxostege sticticalis TaxID=481309 RepID=A0ABD0S3S7_LOXSC